MHGSERDRRRRPGGATLDTSQRRAAGVPGKATLVGASPGMALPPALRQRLERALSTDLSAVRVGVDPGVAAMGARAVASGTDVHFAPGAYAPGTPSGDQLVAHEIVHLLQQAEGRVPVTAHHGDLAFNRDGSLEAEADDLAERALNGEVVRASGPAPAAAPGPLQGFFTDPEVIDDVIGAVTDAAHALWNAVSHLGDDTDEHSAKKPSAVPPNRAKTAYVGEILAVVDPDAVVREPTNSWKSTGVAIPIGVTVCVYELDGTFVRVVDLDGKNWGWTKLSNLGPTTPVTPIIEPPNPDKPSPPVLPANDDDWDDLITDARAEMTVTENYAVTTRALNPNLLFAVRTGHVAQDAFYDVLVKKREGKKEAASGSGRTPGQLAYRLGLELTAEADAQLALPSVLAAKLALVTKRTAADGTMDLSKSNAKALQRQLVAKLAPAAASDVVGWFKGHLVDKRLTLDAIGVVELRDVVTSAVGSTASDPARRTRIEGLRSDITACEARVRALLRTKAEDTTRAKDKALWTTLADLADTEGVFVERTLSSYTIKNGDGTTANLEPTLIPSRNLLNPDGFHAGGGKYSETLIDEVLADQYAGDPDQAAKTDAAKRFIHTLNKNEGGPGSMNTWDGEIVSAGPGLSGGGRLQLAMHKYKSADPGGFHDALGRFGVDIARVGKGNPFFKVRVPRDEASIPPAMRGVVTPGQMIIGSDSTGASKSGSAYEECAALRYVSKDPILMARFMYAGRHMQVYLLEEAARSMHHAETFSFLVGDGTRIGWRELIEPLGDDWLGATEAVIAYRYHASAKTYEALKVEAKNFYEARFGATRAPADLDDSQRKEIGKHIGHQLKEKSYPAFRAQFPSVAAEVFPPAKGKGKGKGDDDDGDDDDVPGAAPTLDGDGA